jgi:hypothetical protein
MRPNDTLALELEGNVSITGTFVGYEYGFDFDKLHIQQGDKITAVAVDHIVGIRTLHRPEINVLYTTGEI